MTKSISIVATAAVVFAATSLLFGQDKDQGVFHLESHGDSIWVRHFPVPTSTTSSVGVLLIPGWPATGNDVLGLGAALSASGVHVFVLHPRGHEGSGGEAGFANALEDVQVAWDWLAAGDGGASFGIEKDQRILAGYSWGGGIAAVFAAEHPSVKRMISIAGSDHGTFIRRFDSDSKYGAMYRDALASTQLPNGPVNFDVEATLEELRVTRARHDLVAISTKLLEKDILIVAGWDDAEVEVEYQVLPFYRALQDGGASAVRMIALQDDHAFRQVRDALHLHVLEWIGEPRWPEINDKP
jgi:pimeloyl-ACP methyl ester carboxylesterase